MVNKNRRDLCVGLSLLAAGAAALPFASEAEASSTGRISAPAAPGETVLCVQRAYLFDQLPVKKNANGESRAVMRGVLPTGEAVEVHETTLLPGHMPHPPHKHRHSELMLIREGTVEFDNDGAFERVGPGGVIFAASNVMHGLKNVGERDAVYFVVAIGTEGAVRERLS